MFQEILDANAIRFYVAFAFNLSDSAYFDGEDETLGRAFLKAEAQAGILSAVAAGGVLDDIEAGAQAQVVDIIAENAAIIAEAEALTEEQCQCLGFTPDVSGIIASNAHFESIDWVATRTEVDAAIAAV